MGSGWSREADFQSLYERFSKVYDQQIADEISLRNEEFEQKRAIELATRQQRFKLEAVLGTIVVGTVAVASTKYKRPWIAVSFVVPVIMMVGYRFDAAFGGQQKNIKARAEHLLKEERERFQLVGGPITLAEVDQRVATMKRLKDEVS